MIDHAHPTPLSAAASFQGAASPSLELGEARQLRDALKTLLRKEQTAMADFLVALADFDRRRGWEALGHANLFAFINSGLGLSPAPTYWRQEAARLLQRFPDLVAPLRRGELCLTTMAELAKVLTMENEASVLPRFLGISSREAKEIVAELRPREAPATRTVVTRLPEAALLSTTGAGAGLGSGSGLGAGTVSCSVDSSEATTPMRSPLAGAAPSSFLPSTPIGPPPSQLWAPKVDFGGVAGAVTPRDEIEPLSVERSRLHVNVSRQFTRKLEAARQGLGHSISHATIEQALEAALDLLLEKQARVRGLVKRPRASLQAPALELPLQEPPPPRRDGPRETIPAAVRRAVWERDGGRCAWPLDAGGCCGSTHRLELDHLVPWALGGESTVANLRLTCHRHNRLAARRAFGERCVGRYADRGAGNGAA